MSFLDDAKKKLTDAVTEHGDQIKEGLDKAGRTIDDKTGGRYADKIERGSRAANQAVDNLSASGTPKPADPRPAPRPGPGGPATDPAPGNDPGGAGEPGPPNDPTNPTG